MSKEEKLKQLEKELFDTFGHSWACDEDKDDPLKGCVCEGGKYWRGMKPIIKKYL